MNPHYLIGFFQDLDLIDPDGKRALFHLVVASHSVNFVVETTTRESEIKAVFDSLVDHIAPGGYALIFPFAAAPSLVFDRGSGRMRPLDGEWALQWLRENADRLGVEVHHLSAFPLGGAAAAYFGERMSLLVIHRQ
jgi:hypothetical protein